MSEGICPHCTGTGEVGAPCHNPACVSWQYYHIPEPYYREFQTGTGARDHLIGQRIDEYLLVKRVGEGGHGAVYLALQMPLMMLTALKLLKKADHEESQQSYLEQKFQKEARALASLTHPNIVRLLKFGFHVDTPYMVMEYVEGGNDLADEYRRRWDQRIWFSPQEVRGLMEQLLKAMGAAHQKRIIHRDLKPANILLQSLPESSLFVRVTDFGLVKFLSDETDVTQAQGTPRYMAPEQIFGRKIGPWTDLYSLTLVLVEMLSGAWIYQHVSTQSIYEKKVSLEHDIVREARLQELPELCRRFIVLGTHPVVTERIGTVQEYQTGLEEALDELDRTGWPTSSAGQEPGGNTGPSPERRISGVAATISDPGIQPTWSRHRQRKQEKREPLSAGSPSHLLRRPSIAKALLIFLLLLGSITGAVLLSMNGSVGGGPDEPDDDHKTTGSPDATERPGSREFQINSTTVNNQRRASVAAWPSGKFVTAWESDPEVVGRFGVYTQVFSEDLVPLDSELAVSPYHKGKRMSPIVITLDVARFLVLWNAENRDGDGLGIIGRIFDDDGRSVGDEIILNLPLTRGKQAHAHAAKVADNGFVVVWNGNGGDLDDRGVFGRRFSADGVPQGDVFLVNSFTPGEQGNPRVAALGGDEFVVVWESAQSPDGDRSMEIHGQVFSGEGTPIGEIMMLNGYWEGEQRYPDVAALGGERFVVAWSSQDQDGDGWGVFGCVRHTSGRTVRPDFQVNTNVEGSQWISRVVAFDDGAFLVFWMDDNKDSSGFSVVGQGFRPDGSRCGDEFRFNQHEDSNQQIRSVAALGGRNYLAVWDSVGQDGDGYGVFGRTGTLECATTESNGPFPNPSIRDSRSLVSRVSPADDAGFPKPVPTDSTQQQDL